jgi:ABC-type branched-subunit amino acid transport system substrate-binding protein
MEPYYSVKPLVMQKRGVRSLVFAGFLTTSLLLAGCSGSIGVASDGDQTDSAQDSVKIGLLAPITGPVSPEGNALKTGFEIAIEEINENGGVLGKPVEVVFGDDKADPANATQLAQKFIQQDKVNYIFGTITGDTTVAVAKAAAESKIPVSGAILGDAGYCGPYFWPFGETGYQLLEGLVPHMTETYGTKVALVGADYVFPREFNKTAKVLLEPLGATVVAEEYAPLGTADWQPVLQKLRSAEPDWILTSVVGGDAISFTQQADAFGILDSAAITGISLNQEFYPALQAQDNGGQMVVRYSDQLEGDLNASFVAKYRAKTNSTDPIPSVAANAYVGALFVAAAIEQAGSTEGDEIVKALASLKLSDTILGDVEFNADNHSFQSKMYLVDILEGGKYVPTKDLGVIVDETQKQCG